MDITPSPSSSASPSRTFIVVSSLNYHTLSRVQLRKGIWAALAHCICNWMLSQCQCLYLQYNSARFRVKVLAVENCTAKGQPPRRTRCEKWKLANWKNYSGLPAGLATWLPFPLCGQRGRLLLHCPVGGITQGMGKGTRGAMMLNAALGASQIYLHLAGMAWNGTEESKSLLLLLLLWPAIFCHFNVKVKVDSLRVADWATIGARQLSVCQSLCLYLSLSVSLFVSLSAALSVFLFFCPSVALWSTLVSALQRRGSLVPALGAMESRRTR